MSGRDAGYVGAVSIVVNRICVFVHKIIPADHLMVGPQLTAKGRVGVVHSGIDNRNGYPGTRAIKRRIE